MDSVVTLSPVEVKYEDGYTYCEVEAAIWNGMYGLKPPIYGSPSFRTVTLIIYALIILHRSLYVIRIQFESLGSFIS